MTALHSAVHGKKGSKISSCNEFFLTILEISRKIPSENIKILIFLNTLNIKFNTKNSQAREAQFSSLKFT